MDWYPLWNSLRIAAISSVLVFFCGIAAAYYVAKAPRLVKGVLDVVLTLPLVLPPTVCGWLLLLVFGVILAKTEFGRYVYMVGGNAGAARLAGIKVNWTKVKLFMISGALSALGGLILAARMNSGQPGAADSVDFDAITAVVLGGIAMTGGTGTMFGTFLGLMVLLTLNNGLLILGVTTYWQDVAKGLVLIFALTLDYYRTKRRNRVTAG